MAVIPGSDIINSTLYVVSQSLLLPVIAVLLIMLVYVVIEGGGIISEYTIRRKTTFLEVESFITNISNNSSPAMIKDGLEDSELPKTHKEILEKIADSNALGVKSREVLARKLIEEEEIKAIKKIEKTDIIAKIAPAIGLMGTLIPMGPGLAALGAGDITTLSQNLMVAFDAAILGMASAAIAFTISRVRRRWYEDQISTLDAMAESLLEVIQNAKEEKKTYIE
ncbi:MAG: MotA/TolQ/ExbB proton channel family protein [Methanobacterium sp.]|uniref:MotA/TolQ/ExbB proton channel family protein n=1 Tax=Methanobacterium sp. TaxID=2164 RepID=UPI003C75E7BD